MFTPVSGRVVVARPDTFSVRHSRSWARAVPKEQVGEHQGKLNTADAIAFNVTHALHVYTSVMAPFVLKGITGLSRMGPIDQEVVSD